MSTFTVSGPQEDAIIAGLRLLQHEMSEGRVALNDGDIGSMLTCMGEHAGLTITDIDQLLSEVFSVDS